MTETRTARQITEPMLLKYIAESAECIVEDDMNEAGDWTDAEFEVLYDRAMAWIHRHRDAAPMPPETPEPTARATRYEVSCLSEGDINAHTWMVAVEYRGHDRWAVLRSGGHMCLSIDGEWDWESIPSEREDDWLATHRFDLDTALALAKEHAPKLVINGMTAADVFARGEQP